MKKETKYILGIDGGGTKTSMVLADENCRVLAKIKTGQSNVHNAHAREIITVVRQGMFDLFKNAKLSKRTRFDAVGAGVSGLDSDKDREVANRIIKKALSGHLPRSKNIKIVNDAVIGFWSGTDEEEGICIIGGTGSNCYGVTRRGREAWAGGLGHILSDEGGGYYQGMRALKAITKSADGRGPKTMLERMILKHYQVKDVRGLVPFFYYDNQSKTDIGRLALYVEEAAVKGDKTALRIARDSADELVIMVKAVADQLNFSHKAFPLVMVGGVLQDDPVVNRRFKKEIRKLYPQAIMITPRVKPVMGAVEMALSTLK